MSLLKSIFDAFESQKVLIIGDAMVDAYRWGTIERMSPEAPVPVVSVHKRENRLGGAANVALNVQSLGGEAILCSVIGKDQQGATFLELMNEAGLDTSGLIQLPGRPTTVKTRVISDNKHVLRLDEEDLNLIVQTDELLIRIKQLIDQHAFNVIVFEDYNKGMLSKKLISETIAIAKDRQIPTLVDPKKDHFMDYCHVTLFKPNLKELCEGLELEINPKNMNEVESAVTTLRNRLNAGAILLTLSENGVFIKNHQSQKHIPAVKRNIVDVSGAGDTVVAVAAMALAHGFNIDYIATIANLAGGLVCEQAGVVPIDRETLYMEAKKYLD